MRLKHTVQHARWYWLFGLLLVLMAAPCFSKDRPNILWIFCDDLAVDAVGAYGGRFAEMDPTPNIDRIAHEGMRFDKAYVANSLCIPSRATLLTGKHTHKNRKTVIERPFNHNQVQFQKLIGQGGYQSALFGKIHLSGMVQGFDHWETLNGQGKYMNPRLHGPGGTTRFKGHSTDVITDRALNWYHTMRDPEKPFILMLHYKAPHRPWDPAPRFLESFKDKTFPEPDTLFDTYATRKMAAKHRMGIAEHMTLPRDLKADRWEHREHLLDKNLSTEELTRLKYQAFMQDYFACAAGVDENVGRLLKQLEEDGLEEQTVVMFASDQGFYLGEHGWFDKRWMYEESFRMPLLVKWPGVIKPGSQNTNLVQNIDFAETFLDIAGLPAPQEMQGESLIPLFKGFTPDNWRKSLYYRYYVEGHGVTAHEGVAYNGFKLLRFYGRNTGGSNYWELFDLQQDPAELTNLFDAPGMADKVVEMKAELSRLRAYYDVPEKDLLMPRRSAKKKK